MDEKINEKAQAFLKEYGELVTKHKMDFASWPVFVPNSNGTFTVTIQSQPVDVTQQLDSTSNNVPPPDKFVETK